MKLLPKITKFSNFFIYLLQLVEIVIPKKILCNLFTLRNKKIFFLAVSIASLTLFQSKYGPGSVFLPGAIKEWLVIQLKPGKKFFIDRIKFLECHIASLNFSKSVPSTSIPIEKSLHLTFPKKKTPPHAGTILQRNKLDKATCSSYKKMGRHF